MQPELHHALVQIEQRILHCTNTVEQAHSTTTSNLSRVVRNQSAIVQAIQALQLRLDRLEQQGRR